LEAEIQAATPPKTIMEDKEKWVSLFNVKNLNGWKTRPEWDDDWHVENDVLIWNSLNPCLLWTERDDYSDFHLRIETRLGDQVYAQVQACNTFGPMGEIWGGYSIVLNSTNDNASKTGSLLVIGKGIVVDAPRSPVPPDEWFTLEVIIKRNRVIVKVKGETMADHTAPGEQFARGHITLSKGNKLTEGERRLEFRKIEIKELREP
jgi:Domain of Unknown Function (DUF1080)